MAFGAPPGGRAKRLTDPPDPPQEIFVKNFTSPRSRRQRPPGQCGPTAGNACEVKQPLEKKHYAEKPFILQSIVAIRKTALAMNKAELIESIQKALGADATKRSAEEALDAVLSSISKGVKKDKKVQIIGFGTFEVKKRAARLGRNPKTGEALKIAASKSVGFKASAALKASL
jgi:DNA-binding protein HU-beta